MGHFTDHIVGLRLAVSVLLGTLISLAQDNLLYRHWRGLLVGGHACTEV